jgi:hypothetical protein
MNKRKYIGIIMIAGTLFGALPPGPPVLPGPPGPPVPAPEPMQWKVHLASLPLAVINHYTLKLLLVPLTIKANTLFRSEPLSPGHAFTGLVAAERFLGSPLNWLIRRTGFLTDEELKQAQRNAMVYASLYYVAPESLKNRIKTIWPALQRLFFKKTKDGISVKSFEDMKELVPVIQNFNNGIKDEYSKIIKFEAMSGQLQNEIKKTGLADKARKTLQEKINKNLNQYKEAVAEFSNLLVKRETQREKLYENYEISELIQLKDFAQRVMVNTQSKTVDDSEFSHNFNQLKDLYTKIQGGILGIVGEGLKYFED